MIDGIKIASKQHPSEYWSEHPDLSFISRIDEKTGEILDDGTFAEYKALFFTIYPYKPNPVTRTCYIRGSLARYYKEADTNAFDFNMDDVRSCLNRFQTEFDLNLNTCSIHGLEIGFNVEVPKPIREVLNCIKQVKGSCPNLFRQNRHYLGLTLEHQEYDLKIYDKGRQARTGQNNLLRIELVVKKMNFLKHLEIKTLEDLKSTEKIKTVALMIIQWWQEAIFIEKSMNYKLMTSHEQKKWLYYSNTVNWQNFNLSQRKRAKQHFKKLIAKYCFKSLHAEISALLIKKVEKLSTENGTQIIQKSQEITSLNCPVSIPLSKWIEKEQNDLMLEKLKSDLNRPKKSRQCDCCKMDISHKKHTAKFCGGKCKNRFNAKKRTKQNRQLIKQENQNFKKLIELAAKNELWLWISYGINNRTHTEHVHQSVVGLTKEQLKLVFKLKADTYRENYSAVELSHHRARKLLKFILKQNNKC